MMERPPDNEKRTPTSVVSARAALASIDGAASAAALPILV